MMDSRRFWKSSTNRAGFTLIEMLLVTAIIGILIAIIVPAIQQARAAARRTECRNHLKQLGIALHAFAPAHNGFFPRIGISAGEAGEFHAWTITLLPYIEQDNIYTQLKQDPSFALSNVLIPLYTCPDDPSAAGVAGQLSYVVNFGYAGRSDVSGSPVTPGYIQKPAFSGPDVPYSVVATNGHNTKTSDGGWGTGMFWADRAVRLSNVTSGDGTTNTVAATENIYAGSWAQRVLYADNRNPPEGDPFLCQVAFGIGDDGIQLEGESSAGNDLARPTSLRILSTNLEQYAINVAVNHQAGGSEGLMPAPNARHQGGAHMLWVDGRVTFVAEGVDEAVYARSLTWNGGQNGQSPDTLSSGGGRTGGGIGGGGGGGGGGRTPNQ